MEEEFDLLEYFDEFTHQICGVCLKLCVSPDYWIHPTPEFLSIYIEAKPKQEINECPSCLEKQMGVKI